MLFCLNKYSISLRCTRVQRIFAVANVIWETKSATISHIVSFLATYNNPCTFQLHYVPHSLTIYLAWRFSNKENIITNPSFLSGFEKQLHY